MRHLADTLLTVMATVLGGPDDLFTRHTAAPWDFTLSRYPPAHETGPATPCQYRVGPHTDVGLITLLDRQTGRGGLQVHDDVHGWQDAPWEPGTITLNIGDLMARWGGDRWRSGRHRVLPPPPDAPHEELTSLVYFHSCTPGTTVESLPAPLGRRSYAPVVACEYFESKMAAIRATEQGPVKGPQRDREATRRRPHGNSRPRHGPSSARTQVLHAVRCPCGRP
ncbi:isopenicillin N synthase family oxygenase [Streptomyces arenae]|nr:isopenicillin N synthase family oxygenase [Streptomyces arenae]